MTDRSKLVFISYRRSDSFNLSRILARSLREDFGDDAVLFDETTALPGVAWPASIQAAVERADAFIPVIGPTWLKTYDEESGRRRIDLPDDWVRTEIVSFINRAKADPNLTVLPLLLGGATLAIKKHLDDEVLRSLCNYQPMHIHDAGDATDFARVRQRLTQLGFVRVVVPPVSTPIMGRVPVPLTRHEEETFRSEFPEWRIQERQKPGASDDVVRELYRLYEFPSYEMAWEFMAKVNETGIRLYNHHPRWQNNYNRVEVWLCTSNVGHKPSKRDIRLAKVFENAWRSFAASV